MKKLAKSCVVSLCWFACLPALAESVMFETLGKFAQIELPDGMCDYTNTELGEFAKSYLTERAKASELSSQMPEVKVIFAECQGRDDGYPWGWIGSFKEKATGFTQTRLNKYLEQNLGGLLAKIDDKIDSPRALREFEQATGFKLSDVETGVPVVLASTSDLFLHSMAQKTTIEGEPFREVIITASMIRNGRAIYMYSYEIQSKAASVLELAQSMKRSAKSLTVR